MALWLMSDLSIWNHKWRECRIALQPSAYVIPCWHTLQMDWHRDKRTPSAGRLCHKVSCRHSRFAFAAWIDNNCPWTSGVSFGDVVCSLQRDISLRTPWSYPLSCLWVAAYRTYSGDFVWAPQREFHEEWNLVLSLNKWHLYVTKHRQCQCNSDAKFAVWGIAKSFHYIYSSKVLH